MELCDLIAQNPAQFGNKIAWICSRCPPAESLMTGSPTVSRSQLHAILAVARFLSKCPNSEHETPKALILAFYRSIPLTFNPKFWPQAFYPADVSSFFTDFMSYISNAAELCPKFSSDVAGFTGEIVLQTMANADSSISRVFLNALCSNFPPILSADANKLIRFLLDRFDVGVPTSPKEGILTPDVGSAQGSPLSGNYNQSPNVSADSSSSSGIVANGVDNVSWKSNGDLSAPAAYKKNLKFFEDEPVEGLEKQEIVFKLIGHVCSKVAIDPRLTEQVRGIAKSQLSSMADFLKVMTNSNKLAQFRVKVVAIKFDTAKYILKLMHKQLSLKLFVALTDTEARLVGAGAVAESQDKQKAVSVSSGCVAANQDSRIS